ncbi:DUF6090 family protein [Planktosalinus lacus]|uniref:Uncharacterized protein n=1 Tax=Planktosalinus lacus TaxID=1526573 RepID=A0A8J2VBD5_9FLAO|nr:DUF6090 family protein [Planktosalinus lacus]GGE01984.1 hypothetical protein GCM10011312_26690 [Planktosalinus lacus]
MIKFFRKIRKKLIEEDNVRKYLLYAIGEIVLVVIGILIALQINNWNEEKIMDRMVSQALSEIREDLVQDTLTLQSRITLQLAEFEAQTRVVDALTRQTLNEEEHRSDLGKLMLMRETVLLRNGYDYLKDLGISHLNRPELRQTLLQYYEHDYAMLRKDLQNDEFEFEDVWLPYARVHFKDWEFGEYAVPHSYSNIQNDTYLLTTLKINLTNKDGTIRAHSQALETAKSLITMLETR